jgi:hypothetical protein
LNLICAPSRAKNLTDFFVAFQFFLAKTHVAASSTFQNQGRFIGKALALQSRGNQPDFLCLVDGELSSFCSKMKKSGHRLETSKGNPWSRSRQSKQPDPADPEFSGDGTLFKHNSFTAKWCVACSINTWEKSCVENPHKTYKLTREEQDKGVLYLRCTKCGLHICNICAKLFSDKLQSLTKRLPIIPAWCQLVDSFLSQARMENDKCTVQISPEHCFSCQHKHCSDTLPLQSTSTGILPAPDIPAIIDAIDAILDVVDAVEV